MNKSEKNFFFAVFLFIVSIILFINAWEYGIMTLLAAFSHLKDSDDFKKIIEKHKENRKTNLLEIEENDKNKNIKLEDDKIKLKEELNSLVYKRSGLSILLKTLSVLGILGYTTFLGYTDYISNT